MYSSSRACISSDPPTFQPTLISFTFLTPDPFQCHSGLPLSHSTPHRPTRDTRAIGSSTTASLDSMASGSNRSQNQTSITFAAIAVAASNNPPCPDLDADI
ncbi:hypothetical protein EDC04DRAFT_2907875 [Pisolithus marmoratus]|nr:hypothetical protein EDC04DRAFT_2907875 [Pisolithus marmoratus]